MDGCPEADRGEVAFIGRSNVGKSSLVNMVRFFRWFLPFARSDRWAARPAFPSPSCGLIDIVFFVFGIPSSKNAAPRDASS